MRFSAIKSATKKAAYTLPDNLGVINFTFRPSIFTSEFLDKLAKPETTTVDTANMLASALVETDLTDDEDKPLEITGGVIYSTLPISVVMGMLEAMQEANSPKKTSKTGSSGSFSAEDPDDE